MTADRNVLGEELEACSLRPMTGFYRTGCCATGTEDEGAHASADGGLDRPTN